MIFGISKKRLTAVVLSLAMTAGTAAAVFADGTAETMAVREVTVEEKNAEKLLEMLDIIRSGDKYSAETEITRGYFTALVSRALMTEGSSADIRTIFRDVAEDYKWANELAGMYRAGYISGDGDRRFLPEDKITVYEAVTIAVSGLGYRQKAMIKGGWPTGFIMEAKRLGLISGKSGEETLSCGEAALLLKNMLEAEAAIPTGVDGKGDTVYSVSENLLSRLYDVYTVEGIVTENGITGLYSDAADENSIAVDGLRIKNTKNEDLSELLGLSVKLWCREDGGEYEYMMLKDSSRNTVYSMNGWDNKAAYERSGNLISYDDGDKDKTLRLSGEFRFIYNGKAEDDYLKYTADLSKSTVRVIENNGDGLYDVLIVETYNTLVADATGSTSTSVASKYTGFPTLNPEDYHRVDFTDMQGSKLTVPDISRGDVISWYASGDKSYAKIVKSSLTVDGKISGTVSDEYIIDGKHYKAAPTVADGAVTLEIGKSGTFGLDIFGRIAEFSKDVDSSEGFGLLIAHKRKGDLDGTVQAKILNESRELRVYTLADRVRINDESVKKENQDAKMTEAEAANDDEDGTKKEDVIKFKTNDDGLITSIDFALDSVPTKENAHDGMLYKYKTKASRPYKENTGNMYDSFIIDKSKTVVLGIDTNFDYGEDDRYFVMSGSQFGNDTWITAEAYTTKKEPDKAEVIVYYGVPASNGMNFFAINTIGETLNDEGESVYTASGFTPSGAKDAVIDSELVEKLDLSDGDIIGVASKVDAKGVLYAADLIYDYSENEMKKNLVGDDYFFGERAFMLYPYSYSGSVIKWFMAESSEEAEKQYAKKDITENELHNTLVPTGAVYVADGSRGDIYKKGSMADIVSYVQNPNGFSDIIVHSKWGNTQFVIIINRQKG